MISFPTELVKQTGLKTKGELDSLFGVSRLMVIKYMNGKSMPRGGNLVRISKTLKVLNDLVDKGKLPLPAYKDAEARKRAVIKIKDYVEAQ
jgi:hypothetical protein